MLKRLGFAIASLLLALSVLPSSYVQGAEPQKVHGSFGIAYPGYESFNLVIGLTDASGLFGKDPVYLASKDKQMLGKYTGNAASGSYEVTLPAEPEGRPFDLTGSGTPTSDILIYDIRMLSDVGSRGYMVTNEDALASSLKLTLDAKVKGGKLLVWVADEKAQFPTDLGADNQLFTADDPRAPLSLGWSVIDLDKSPFIVIREPDTKIDLNTTSNGDVVDYSKLTCDQLIPAFLDRIEPTYPFAKQKNIDWAALRARVVPASKTTKTQADCERLIRDIANAIPDGHVNFSLPALQDEYAGSIGMGLTPTSDGQIVVTLLRDGGPADKAGIKLGAVITEFDGKPIMEAVKAVVLQYTNASTPATLLDAQLGMLLRGPMESSASVTYKNPGEEVANVTLTRDTPQRSNGIQKSPVPVKDNKLPSGIGYVHIEAFEGRATLENFDKAIDQLINENVPGIIIDIRSNPGGLSQMSDAMASRFFETGFNVGKQYTLDGRFSYEDVIDPRPPLYKGCVVVLVDLYTASSGDIFAYTMKKGKRAIIVGNTHTQGIAGTVSGGYYTLPNDGFIQVPTGGMYDENNEIVVEGKGVEPDIKVPVTIESLLSPEDTVLAAGEAATKDCKLPQ